MNFLFWKKLRRAEPNVASQPEYVYASWQLRGDRPGKDGDDRINDPKEGQP